MKTLLVLAALTAASLAHAQSARFCVGEDPNNCWDLPKGLTYVRKETDGVTRLSFQGTEGVVTLEFRNDQVRATGASKSFLLVREEFEEIEPMRAAVQLLLETESASVPLLASL